MAMTALIVEDEPSLLEIYSRVIHTMGFEILRAANGEAAIEMLDTHQPELLILDILLPRVNGLAVLEHIAASPHLKETHIVVISSNHHFGHQIKDFPNAVFMEKPIRPTDLRSLIQQVR